MWVAVTAIEINTQTVNVDRNEFAELMDTFPVNYEFCN